MSKVFNLKIVFQSNSIVMGPVAEEDKNYFEKLGSPGTMMNKCKSNKEQQLIKGLSLKFCYSLSIIIMLYFASKGSVDLLNNIILMK